MPEIIVIGGGVIGLSSALALQATGYNPRILTREAPTATTSAAAGAIWSGRALEGREQGWAHASLERYLRLCGDEESGVSLQRVRKVYPVATPDPWYGDQLPFCQRIAAAELPAGTACGFLMDVPIVQPPLYLQRLQEQFLANGGSLQRREVDSLDALLEESALLVNCSGVGARDLADDPAVYPIRGQTALVAARVSPGYMDEETFTYLFPRRDGTLLGGNLLPGDWRRELDAGISADILARCTAIEPALAKATVLRERVGLRPGRHEVRLEMERRAGGVIIHNYGHGGIGFTLSWGCALDVVSLAQSLAKKGIEPQRTQRAQR